MTTRRCLVLAMVMTCLLTICSSGSLAAANSFPRKLTEGNCHLINITASGVVYLDLNTWRTIFVHRIEQNITQRVDPEKENPDLLITEVRANDCGQIVFGMARRHGPPGETYVYIWDEVGGLRQIATATLGGENYGKAHLRINNRGEIVYRSEVGGLVQLFAYLPNPGRVYRLTYADHLTFEYPALNDVGEIVTRSYNANGAICKLFSLHMGRRGVLKEITAGIDRHWTVTELNNEGKLLFSGADNGLYICDIRSPAPPKKLADGPANFRFEIALNDRYLAFEDWFPLTQKPTMIRLLDLLDPNAGSMVPELGRSGYYNESPAVNKAGDVAWISFNPISAVHPRIILCRKKRTYDFGEGYFVRTNDDYVAWEDPGGNIIVDKISRVVDRGKKIIPAINLLLLGNR